MTPPECEAELSLKTTNTNCVRFKCDVNSNQQMVFTIQTFYLSELSFTMYYCTGHLFILLSS